MLQHRKLAGTVKWCQTDVAMTSGILKIGRALPFYAGLDYPREKPYFQHQKIANGVIRTLIRTLKNCTLPLPYRGAPPLQSGGQNQKWPTSGQIGYLTPAVSGIPTAAERRAKSEVAHKWAN